MNQVPLILCAGLVAGTMNALAGGGSFITVPALIAVGVPSVQANASSTVALLPGGIASAWAYRGGMASVGGISLGRLAVASLTGGALGALLLLSTPSRYFDFELPWLLLLATVALSFGRRIGELLRRHWQIGASTVLVIQFALGIYGGYFGGAVGIMMMAAWHLLDGSEIKNLNYPRTLLVCAANLMAVLFFISAHAVRWPETFLMLVAAALGGYGGARIGRVAPREVIRWGTLALTSGITIAFFVRAYG